MRTKSKALANLVRRRRAGSFAAGETREISNPPQYSQQKFLIFVKLETQRVFTPMHLTTKTVRGLLRRLESKFPGEVKSAQVRCYHCIQVSFKQVQVEFKFELEVDATSPPMSAFGTLFSPMGDLTF